MNYYLIPVENLRYEDEFCNMQQYLKNIHPTVYRHFEKRSFRLDEFMLELLYKYNIPKYFLLIGESKKFSKNIILTEIISDSTIVVPKYWVNDYEVKRNLAIHYLSNLSILELETVAKTFSQFVSLESRSSKIVPFPIERIK